MAKIIHTMLKPIGIYEWFILCTLKWKWICQPAIRGVTEKCTPSKCEYHSYANLSESLLQAEASRIWNEHLNMLVSHTHSDLQLGAYWHCVSHLLNIRWKQQRLFRCKKTAEMISKNRHCDILFTDRRFFATKKKWSGKMIRYWQKTV